MEFTLALVVLGLGFVVLIGPLAWLIVEAISERLQPPLLDRAK
jgi:hypothetical protein